MLYELVVELIGAHLTGAQVRGRRQHARSAGIDVITVGLASRILLLRLRLCLLGIVAQRSVQSGRDTHVQHAAAQYEYRAMESAALRQVLYQYG